jgi:polyferredoxin
MKLKILKKVRVMVSLTSFLLIVSVFLDFSFSISENIADFVIYFQFIPSLLKFLLFGALATAGSIFIMGLTLIFGRVYCSFFCPMGVLQDIFAYIPKKIEYVRVLKRLIVYFIKTIA